MRILLITPYFPPDTGSAAHLFYELGSALVDRGHDVCVVTSMPGYHARGSLDRYRGKWIVIEVIERMQVVRVVTPQFSRASRIGRGVSQFASAMAYWVVAVRQRGYQAAIVYSPPLPLALTATGLKIARGMPFILNVQDLFPQNAIDLGLLKNRFLIRLFEALEKYVYQLGCRITVHSSGNRAHIIGRGADPEFVSVCPNWIDTNFLVPGPRQNDFSREHGLDGRFVASFAGVLGYSQDIDVILGAAEIVQSVADLLFLIVGDGVERSRLEAKAKEMKLNNVRFLPMQPRSKYCDILHASDVCLVTLRKEVKTPVVPSKILSAMAAARPVIASLNIDGDARELIENAGCGFVGPAGDPQVLATAILDLHRNPMLCAEMGRRGREYVQAHSSLATAVAHYEKVLNLVVAGKQDAEAATFVPGESA
jgi:colanic acid biosynthesis glycosyl transferase WcaI